MSDNEKSLFWICVILTMGMAFTALMIALPRVCEVHSNINFDYQTMIVTILGIFITALIGWQIWQTIASREEIKDAREAANKLNEIETELQKQRDFFEVRNLEIQHLIDAHAKLSEAEKINDLSDKYIAYAESIELLLKSNVDLSYEQFERAQYGLMSVLAQFSLNTDPLEADDFIKREKEYEYHYNRLIAQLNQRNAQIEDFKDLLTQIRDHRKSTIKIVMESGMGKRIEKSKQLFRAHEQRLREKEAARKASEAKGDTTP